MILVCLIVIQRELPRSIIVFETSRGLSFPNYGHIFLILLQPMWLVRICFLTFCSPISVLSISILDTFFLINRLCCQLKLSDNWVLGSHWWSTLMINAPFQLESGLLLASLQAYSTSCAILLAWVE